MMDHKIHLGIPKPLKTLITQQVHDTYHQARLEESLKLNKKTPLDKKHIEIPYKPNLELDNYTLKPTTTPYELLLHKICSTH